MIKKILPAMIGAALVGGMAPALADVTVFGHLDTSVDYRDQNRSSTNLNCNTCSLGFKGSEDLGNGLKAIFKVDFQFDMTERNPQKASTQLANVNVVTPTFPTGTTLTSTTVVLPVVVNTDNSSSITDRDQWLGLAGNFGQLRFGTISTIYKSHGAMIDPVYRTSVQARGIGLQSTLHKGAGEDGQGRAEDTIRYDSPSWNGLKLGATYTMQTDNGIRNTNSPFGVGAEYKNGPFLVFVDYITNDAGGDDDAAKIGGKWTFGNYSLYGQYEADGGLISCLSGTQRSLGSCGETSGSGDGADVWEIGGTGTWGNNMLVAAYGQGDETSGGKFNPTTFRRINNGYSTFEIVGVHSLSKRTSVYGGYARIEPDGRDYLTGSSDESIDNVTLGMKHLF
jgi:predicted porin